MKRRSKMVTKKTSYKGQNNSNLFAGTYTNYMKYRPGIPNEVVKKILTNFKVSKQDIILDIGCGTGQVALAIDGKCREIICTDSDPGMINEAKKALGATKSKIFYFNYNSAEIKKLKKDFNYFKVATICRAFHWMNQTQVLSDLDNLIMQDGGIAIFGDGSFWTGEEEWQKIVKKVVQKYLGEERRAGKNKYKQPTETWEEIISRSPFNKIKQYKIKINRNWNIENIIGWLFSSSFASPNHFGRQIQSFKKDIKKELLSYSQEGTYTESAVFSIILASRK